MGFKFSDRVAEAQARFDLAEYQAQKAVKKAREEAFKKSDAAKQRAEEAWDALVQAIGAELAPLREENGHLWPGKEHDGKLFHIEGIVWNTEISEICAFRWYSGGSSVFTRVDESRPVLQQDVLTDALTACDRLVAVPERFVTDECLIPDSDLQNWIARHSLMGIDSRLY